MRFAEHCCERNVNDLITIVIGDVQSLATPVFCAGRHDERSYRPMGVFTGFDEVIDCGAVLIDQHTACIGVMEIVVRHVPSPPKSRVHGDG
jgi:hypothetical protein